MLMKIIGCPSTHKQDDVKMRKKREFSVLAYQALPSVKVHFSSLENLLLVWHSLKGTKNKTEDQQLSSIHHKRSVHNQSLEQREPPTSKPWKQKQR